MKKVVAYFFLEYNLCIQTKRFKNLLYLFLTIKAFYWLFYYQLYFGQNAIAFIKPYNFHSIKDVAFYLYNSIEIWLGYFFIFGTLLFVLLSYLIKKAPFIFEFVIWLLVLNIHNKLYPTLTGGDFLLNQFLFFNCFLAKTNDFNLSWQNSLSKALHNFGVTAIVIQIQFTYLLAGLAKLYSSDWISGSALIKLNGVEHFNLFSSPVIGLSSVNYVFDYCIIFYQLLFPVLIWMNKIKKPFMLIGIITHLYIAFITGLVSFGIIMLIAYTFFWPEKKVNSASKKINVSE